MRKIIILFFAILLISPSFAFADQLNQYLEVEEIIPFTTIYQENSSLDTNVKNILQQGKNGINKVMYKLNFKDGVEVSRQKLYIEVVEKMLPQIEEYGTDNISPTTNYVFDNIDDDQYDASFGDTNEDYSNIYNYQEDGKKELFDAFLIQKMATRTGPSTQYSEPGTYPIETTIKIIERELDNNMVPWGLVEFEFRNVKYRAYTGMKRISCDVDSIPWGKGDGVRASTNASAPFYYGPGVEYAKHKYNIKAGSSIIVYDYENGYAMVDYYDYDEWVRGYILEDYIYN